MLETAPAGPGSLVTALPLGRVMASNNKDDPAIPSRRNLLKSAGLLGTVVAGAGTATHVIAAESSPGNQSSPVREALETLSSAEADTLEALVDRILPSDAAGPGAREARAAHYIDRSLASDHASSRSLYAVGLTLLNEHALQTHGLDFHRLGAEHQDAILTAVQNDEIPGFNPSGAGFFSMVRSHTIQGTFSDPYYGGNRNFVGWDMLGYPGVRLAVSESEVAQGENLAPNHQSAYDSQSFTKTQAGRSGGAGRGN